MTKKDYELVAGILRKELDDAIANQEAYGSQAILYAIRSFGDSFEKENPSFDRRRFYTACGVDASAVHGSHSVRA